MASQKKRTRAEIGRPRIMTPDRIKAVTAALMNTDASVADVARRFEVTAATIYRTCGSKQALLKAKMAELDEQSRRLHGKRPGQGQATAKSKKRMQQRANAKARAKIEW